MPTFEQLKVEAAIVHEVFRRPHKAVRAADPNTDRQPILTNAPIDLTDELEAFFQRRLVRTMQQAFGVCFMADPPSNVPGIVAELLANPEQRLVEHSRALGQALHEAQEYINPPGLVVVLHGKVKGNVFIAIMKLEHESGVRSELIEQADGTRVFAITLEHDLFLTDKTRVFKAGLFLAPEGDPGSDADLGGIRGWVSDDQAGLGEDPVALFFRQTYLGCMFLADPKLETQAFHRTAEAWFNDAVVDPEQRTRYETALIAELASQKKTVTPKSFADEHLDVEHRKPFLDGLKAKGVSMSQFVKDPTLIRNRIRRTAVRTEKGVEVLARPEHLEDEVVKIESGVNGGPDRIEISDVILDVRGR